MNTSHARPRFVAWRSWIAISTLVIGLAVATGRIEPHLVADSPSYLEYPFDSFDGMLRSIRTPGYPAFLRLVSATLGIRAVPVMQMLIHATAAWMLMRELRAWGTPAVSPFAAGIAVALGCTALDNEASVSTDLLAASLGVMTAVSLLAWVRTNRECWPAFGAVLFSVAAISLRPAYLALIPWVTVAGVLLWIYRYRMTPGIPLTRSLMLTCVISVSIALPVIVWSAVRGIVVDDFGFLPFGHQNLAGLTVQFVNEDELIKVAKKSELLAREILASKERYHQDGNRLLAGDDGATMTIESRWDEYVWRIIQPAVDAIHPHDSIASHRAIATFNREIISAYPFRYARWLVLAGRRACWGTAANIVMHPVFLFAIGCAVTIKLLRIFRVPWPKNLTRTSTAESTIQSQSGLDVLFIVAITYFVIQLGFVILTSPPIGRFADAAAIFIPAWIAACVTQSVYLAKEP